ncbi:MAG TPA: type II toxin-antitoxin system mRNA interferase toxin, RelE/StbE family [Chloroflexota bacterium]|jgi:mRNA-degrading endonuclease YafQ of YafQ-DinJ toxin-antitoxin module
MRLEETPHFARRRRRLTQPDARGLAIAMVRLEADPRDPRLRTHKLEGGNHWACSYAYDGRAVFVWAGDLITLLGLGSHDEVC